MKGILLLGRCWNQFRLVSDKHCAVKWLCFVDEYCHQLFKTSNVPLRSVLPRECAKLIWYQQCFLFKKQKRFDVVDDFDVEAIMIYFLKDEEEVEN